MNPTLCLNMIVKNESKIITRLFDSVISIIDSYCICDTGSTDNTLEIIKNYFREKNIPGKIIEEPFRNFAYNRNIALQVCYGMSDYVLLLDADMVLEIKDFDKNSLSEADSFCILQGSNTFYYQNMRIIRNNGLFKYVGVTHEYIDSPSNMRNLTIEKSQLFIKDVGDGGSKKDKFERDIRLLSQGIKDEPTNDRYHFYLANSYHDLGKFEEAIDAYKKRIELGGWREEVWYSYYRIGLCYSKLDKMEHALWNWMEGYNYYPERLEGLYELIKYYRIQGQNKIAFSIFNMCKEYLKQNINRDKYLFLHNDVYQYKLYYEYTIIAAYNGTKLINDEIITLLNNNNISELERNNLLSNMKYYKHILSGTKVVLDDKSIHMMYGDKTTLNSSSSSLVPNKNGDGYQMNVRYVNYLIEEDGTYLNCEKHIISLNEYVELDKNFNILNKEFFSYDCGNRIYVGIEDIRLFYNIYKDKLLYIGTGYHTNDKIGVVAGVYDVSSFRPNEDLLIQPLKYNELKQTFKNTNCEKNWVFVYYNNKSHIIYDWNPLTICELSDDTINVIETKHMPKLFSNVRGSSCGFHYTKKIGEEMSGKIRISIEETEIWFVNHIVSYETPRHYYHIISVFDTNMNLLRYSAPFKFEGEPIEYCLSIVVEDERVIMNYSTWDRTTRIGVYDKKYIDTILKYT